MFSGLRLSFEAPDRARGTSLWVSWVQDGPPPFASGAPFAIGDFEDSYRRDADGKWRIAERQIRLVYVDPATPPPRTAQVSAEVPAEAVAAVPETRALPEEGHTISLTRIAAAWECEQLVRQFALYNDSGHWDRLADLFAEEGIFCRPTDPANRIIGREGDSALFSQPPAAADAACHVQCRGECRNRSFRLGPELHNRLYRS